MQSFKTLKQVLHCRTKAASADGKFITKQFPFNCCPIQRDSKTAKCICKRSTHITQTTQLECVVRLSVTVTILFKFSSWVTLMGVNDLEWKLNYCHRTWTQKCWWCWKWNTKVESCQAVKLHSKLGEKMITGNYVAANALYGETFRFSEVSWNGHATSNPSEHLLWFILFFLKNDVNYSVWGKTRSCSIRANLIQDKWMIFSEL